MVSVPKVVGVEWVSGWLSGDVEDVDYYTQFRLSVVHVSVTVQQTIALFLVEAYVETFLTCLLLLTTV